MTTYSIEKFKQGELDELVKQTNLVEKIDYNCKFIVARQDDNIVGVSGVNFQKEAYPRHEHIIVDRQYQKGKLAAVLMFKTEKWLKEKGHIRYLAFILKSNLKMVDYAVKFGFKLFKTGNKGSWFVKYIGG